MRAQLFLAVLALCGGSCFGQDTNVSRSAIYAPNSTIIIIKSKEPKEKEEEKKEEKTATDERKYRFMYLNAIDFDFQESKSGYVGHLNIYCAANGEWNFGYNAGILKIDYIESQTNPVYREAAVKINPLEDVGPGSEYILQYNEYTRKSKNTAVSIYFQPMLNFFCEEDDPKKTQLYFHAHAELLVNSFETTTLINTIASDTLTISSPADEPAFLRDRPQDKHTIKQTLLNGYFGVGVTCDLYIDDKSSVFFQPTFGSTTNYPHTASVNNIGYYEIDPSKTWYGFYLVRAHYRSKLTSGSEIIVGTDIRGLFPRYDPFYSIYTGLNISLDKLGEIIAGK